MKIRTLLAAGMMAPLAHAQLKPAQMAMAPPFVDVYTSGNVRPHKVAAFTARAAELNKRRAALEEEGKKLDEVRSSEKYKYSHLPQRTLDSRGEYKYFLRIQPPSIEDYQSRVRAWSDEVRDFRKETSEEFILRRTDLAAAAKYQEARQAAIDAALAPAMPMPAGSAPADPVAEPKPSSVPGLPPGVEPAKKKAAPNATQAEPAKPAKKATPSDLPPGMTRR